MFFPGTVDKSVITCRDVYESNEIVGRLVGWLVGRTEFFQYIQLFLNVSAFSAVYKLLFIQIVFFLYKGDMCYCTRGQNRFVRSTQWLSYKLETVVLLNNLTP